MCGITGFLNFDKAPAEIVVVRQMADAIAHRGPDGEGYFVDGAIGLAHRRLAIIDLSSHAHQPMCTQDGRYILTYNGEVYNYQELRIELEALGWGFRSQSDTEVVLYALVQWGASALQRFNGMFAFALWDKLNQTLMFGRDRYGIKPLYVARTENIVVFASEIKAILKHPSVKPQMDKKGLCEYLTFQNFIAERTLFDGVELFPAGCVAEVTLNGDWKQKRYWDYNFAEPASPLHDKQEYVEELDRLFQQAVSRQLVSDVPLGTYLSGGMDSGSITSIAARQLKQLTSFTVGFDLNSASGLELGFDERNSAELISYLTKTEHYEMVLKAGDMERSMKQLVWHLEEPRVGQSYPNFYAAKLASKFVKVVLAGTGGDEIFGGYPWRYYRAVVNDDFEHYIEKYYAFWQRLIPEDKFAQVLAPIRADIEDISTRDLFKAVFKTHADCLVRPEDYINHSLYFEAKTFLHGLLVVEDKLSMAHGLESRVPFLDNDLVDFAMKVPVGLKLGNLSEVVQLNENEPGSKTQKYFQRTSDGKILLREVMKHYIPDSITNAKKQGFSAPDESWFRGESIDYVRDLLFSKSARIFDFVDREEILKLVGEHLDGRANRRLLVWSLLYLEEWLGMFVDGGNRHGQ